MQIEQPSTLAVTSENTPQLLLTLFPAESNFKFTTEELSLHLQSPPSPYLASSTNCTTLSQLMDTLKHNSNGIDSKLSSCKIIRVEVSFDQPILLEQFSLCKAEKETNVHLIALVTSKENRLITLYSRQATEPGAHLSKDLNEIKVDCFAFTESLGIVFAVDSNEKVKTNGKSNENALEKCSVKDAEDVKTTEVLQKYIKKIVLRGLATQQTPPASYSIPLFNYIRVAERSDPDTKCEVEYMLALTLINGRRFIQACEILRKIEGQILESKMMQGGYLRVAGIEILIAESMNQYFQLHEKLKAFKRAIDFSLGNKVSLTNISVPTKYPIEDTYTFLTRFHPNLLKLLLTLLSDKSESFKIAAIKSLDFVIENMGCSLGPNVITILKTILNTHPSNSSIILNESIGTFKPIVPSSRTIKQTKENLISIPSSDKLIPHYNHLLETYGSVLNSVSSHFLHKIFYEIILPVTYGTDLNPELRSVLLEISDRIISICQGDLIPNSVFLNGVIKDQSAGNKKLATAAQTLWQCIKTKLCPNCERVGRRKLVQWIIENMVDIAKKMQSHTASKETIEEDASMKVDAYVEVASILLADKPNEEAPNPLVINNEEDKSDYYELFNPLLYWMNFAIKSEERQELLSKIWNCISLLLKDMKKTINVDSSLLIIPLIRGIADYCKYNSPNVPMLKQLLSILQGFRKFNESTLIILCELVNALALKIPNYPYDEIFLAFDLLYEIVVDLLNENSLQQMILSLTDRYTTKSKAQQETLQKFIKIGLVRSIQNTRENIPQSFFGITVQFCLTKNKDVSNETMEKNDHNRILNKHDNYVNKLNFGIETIRQLNKSHIELYKYLVYLKDIDTLLSGLLSSGHASIRLKAFEILDILCNYFATYYVNAKTGFVTKEQFLLSKYIINLIKFFPETQLDSYIQFNFLNLLDILFQHILPIPSFEAEISKKQKTNPDKLTRLVVTDLENLDTKEIPLGISLTEPKYLHMRLMAGLKVWPQIKAATESPWSNVRSVSYGVICSLIRVDVNDYKPSFQDKLKVNLLPLLLTMLSSSESETKAGGLNILGTFMGLGYDVTGFKITNELNFFRRNSDFISLVIWQRVFQLQSDWESTIKEAATILVQLAAPKESVVQFWKLREESERQHRNYLSERFNNVLNVVSNKLMNKDPKVNSEALSSIEFLIPKTIIEDIPGDKIPVLSEADNLLRDSSQEAIGDNIFVIEKYSDDEIKEIVSIFKNDFKAPKNLWIENRFADTIILEDELAQDNPIITEGFEEIAPERGQTVEEVKHKPSGKMLDILEDKLVENLDKVPHATSTNVHLAEFHTEELLEKRSPKADTLDAEPYRFLPAEEINQDDLEIVELPEGDDDFPSKSDKVPILKNTYVETKDKRPITSKPQLKIPTSKAEAGIIDNKTNKEIDEKGKVTKSIEIAIRSDEEVKRHNEEIERYNTELKKCKEEIKKRDEGISVYREEVKLLKDELKEMKEEMKTFKEKMNTVEIQNAIRELTSIGKIENPSDNKNIGEDNKQPPRKKSTRRPSENSPPKHSSSPRRVSNKGTSAANAIDVKYIGTDISSKLKPRSKPSISLVLQPKRQSKKDKSSNKSFDHHTISNSSRSILAMNSCLKKFQAATPGKVGSYLIAHSTAKRRKVQSTRSKQEIPALSQKSQRNARKNLHSSSLPATPRINLVKKLVHPEQLLDNLKFRAKRKEKRHGKRQPQQNFAQTSPALAAILKSLQPTNKPGNEYVLKSYRTNVMANFSTEKGGRPVKMKPVKVETTKPKEPLNEPAINIDSVQIGFKS